MKRNHLICLPSLVAGGLITANAAVTVDSSTPGFLPPSFTAGPSGLRGSYWQRGVAEIPVDGQALAQGGWADTNAHNTAPTGTFSATTLTYLGNDLTVVDNNPANYLGVDAPSYVGVPGNLDDGLLRFLGYIRITAPGTTIPGFGTNTDDGSRIFIGPAQIITNDGSHGDVTVVDDVTFTDAGYYPVDIRFFNGDWTSDGGHNGSLNPADHGGANMRFISGAPVEFVQMAVPEPATAMVVALLAVHGLTRRRRQSGAI